MGDADMVPGVTLGACALRVRFRVLCYPPRCPSRPFDTAWMPQPCSSSDMAAPSMQYELATSGGDAGSRGHERMRKAHGHQKLRHRPRWLLPKINLTALARR